jgi:gentisate 1,2-dioxygenase
MDGASSTFYTKPDLTPERQAFYERLSARNAAPLWEVLGAIIPPEPRPEAVPVLWHYDEVRPFLMEAGRLLTEREAERRVLILENPGLRGRSRVTGSLYIGLQLILPGEVARCHRHATSAIRFVLEGTGAYTAVEGERTTMRPGDFILTPSWTYHDHGNPGETPTVWLDGLDIPIVNLFDASFAEHYPAEVQPNSIPDGDSLARYGANMLPVDYTPGRPSSPIFNYPYARSRAALEELHRNSDPHVCHGLKMRFVNPATGGYPMPTMATFMQLLPKGFVGASHRQTDSTIYVVVEGRGQSRVGATSYAWGPRDIFVVPSWVPVSHQADEDAVLFSLSDRPAQQALGLWREQAPAR